MLVTLIVRVTRSVALRESKNSFLVLWSEYVMSFDHVVLIDSSEIECARAQRATQGSCCLIVVTSGWCM